METSRINSHEVKPGDVVKLVNYWGRVVDRRVVEVQPEFHRIHACLEEEYHAAKAEGRPPKSVGWPGASLVMVVERKENDNA